MNIHTAAKQGFEKGADAYVRGRPSYPLDAVKYITSLVGNSGVTVDLGAGTGKFTELLALSTTANIIAVEPVEAMRKQIEVIADKQNLANVKSVEGTAENIPLPDNNVDLVVAAQAFHWFATKQALAEIHRVLKPSGALALIWNSMDESVDWISQFTNIGGHLWEHENAPRHQTGEWKKAFENQNMFGELQLSQFRYTQEADLETMKDRVCSRSVIAKSPKEVQDVLKKQVENLLKTHPSTKDLAIYPLAYDTRVYFAKCTK